MSPFNRKSAWFLVRHLQRSRVVFALLAVVLCSLGSTALHAASTQEGADIYRRHCATCHDTGFKGSPLLAKPEQWSARLRQPRTFLIQHVTQGFKGMPAMGGGKQKLQPVEIDAAVDFMLAQILGLEANATAGPNPEPTPGGNTPIALADTLPAVAQTADVHTPAPSFSPAPPADSPVIASASNSVNDNVPLPYPVGSDPVDNQNGHNPSRALNELLRSGRPYHQPPDLSTLASDKYADDVRLGYKIFTETRQYARRYTGNDLACRHCHLDAGRAANAAPMWAAFGMYPSYKRRNDRNNSLEDRIQQCFRFSLNGFAPTLDSPEVRALVAYFHFLSHGVPIGVEMPGRGFPQVVETGKDPSPSRGDQTFKRKCVACHGVDGAGVRNDTGGYLYPPLWGRGAYNKGSGFYDNQTLAGFIKANMPPTQHWSLSDQEALDLAAYINLQFRPWDPRRGMIHGLFD